MGGSVGQQRLPVSGGTIHSPQTSRQPRPVSNWTSGTVIYRRALGLVFLRGMTRVPGSVDPIGCARAPSGSRPRWCNAPGPRPKRRTAICRKFFRIMARRGKKKAILAVAASMLTAIHHMLKDGTMYQDLGRNYRRVLLHRSRTNGRPRDRSSGMLRTHGTDASEEDPSEVELPTQTGAYKNHFKLVPLAPGRP